MTTDVFSDHFYQAHNFFFICKNVQKGKTTNFDPCHENHMV